MSSVPETVKKIFELKHSMTTGCDYERAISELDDESFLYFAREIVELEKDIGMLESELSMRRAIIERKKRHLSNYSDILKTHLQNRHDISLSEDPEMPPPPKTVGGFRAFLHKPAKKSVVIHNPIDPEMVSSSYLTFVKVKKTWDKSQLKKALEDKDHFLNKEASDIAEYKTIPKLKVTELIDVDCGN